MRAIDGGLRRSNKPHLVGTWDLELGWRFEGGQSTGDLTSGIYLGQRRSWRLGLGSFIGPVIK